MNRPETKVERMTGIAAEIESFGKGFGEIAKILINCFSKSGAAILDGTRDRSLLPTLILEEIKKRGIPREDFFGQLNAMLENPAALNALTNYATQVHIKKGVYIAESAKETNSKRVKAVVLANTRLPKLAEILLKIEKVLFKD